MCRNNTKSQPLVSWPRDDAKLERVRRLMAEQELDALVVRAPDNVLYLTNFWGMKGYDAVVFPREGEPVLICLEASEEDADRMGWTDRRALLPRLRRERPAAAGAARARPGEAGGGRVRAGRPRALARHAGGRPDGRRADDLHEGVVRRVPDAADATPLLSDRSRGQDGAGGRADAARERDRRRRDGALQAADRARE